MVAVLRQPCPPGRQRGTALIAAMVMVVCFGALFTTLHQSQRSLSTSTTLEAARLRARHAADAVAAWAQVRAVDDTGAFDVPAIDGFQADVAVDGDDYVITLVQVSPTVYRSRWRRPRR